MAVTEQTITIGYADIKSKVKKHFSIIGKRLSDKQGNILFTGVTLSSTEEDILKQYVKDAAETFVGNFSPLIAGYTDNTDDVVFTYQQNRVSDGKANAFCSLFKSYAVDYVAYSVLSMTYGESCELCIEADLPEGCAGICKRKPDRYDRRSNFELKR